MPDGEALEERLKELGEAGEAEEGEAEGAEQSVGGVPIAGGRSSGLTYEDEMMVDWLVGQGKFGEFKGRQAYNLWKQLSWGWQQQLREYYSAQTIAQQKAIGETLRTLGEPPTTAAGKEAVFYEWLGQQGDWKYYGSPAAIAQAFGTLPSEEQARVKGIYQSILPEEVTELPQTVKLGGAREMPTEWLAVPLGEGAIYFPMIPFTDLTRDTANVSLQNVYFKAPDQLNYTKLRPDQFQSVGIKPGNLFALLNDNALSKYIEDRTGYTRGDLMDNPAIAKLLNQTTQLAMQGTPGALDPNELANKVQKLKGFVPGLDTLRSVGFDVNTLGRQDYFNVGPSVERILGEWGEAVLKPDFTLDDQRKHTIALAEQLNKVDSQMALNYLETVPQASRPYVYPQALGRMFGWTQARIQKTLPTTEELQGLVRPQPTTEGGFIQPNMQSLGGYIQQSKDVALKAKLAGGRYEDVFASTMSGLMGTKDIFKLTKEAEQEEEVGRRGKEWQKMMREIEEKRRLATATPTRTVKL